MATPTAFVSRKAVVSSLSALYVLVWCVLVVFLKGCLVAGETTTSTAAAPLGVLSDSETHLHRLDLSYLHRCGAGDIANAIRWTLEDQRQSTDASREEKEDPNSNIDSTGEEDSLVDIDLTASLIGKNITEILLSLKRSESKDEQQEQQQQQPMQSSSSIRVQLTARRNQLSPQEATAILEFVLANGPTNETTIAAAETIENGEVLDETTPSSEDQQEAEADSAPEPEATQLSEAATVDGNATAATADAAATDATPISSVTPPGVEGDSDDKENRDGRDTESTETEATTMETSTTEKPIVKSQLRPAFVSIQTLDLGWNHLGSSSSRRSGARTVNASLRKLLANSERCPPTIRLDVCGLGPQACRDLAKGIVDRYQTQETTPTSALPTPLTLELACNEGIGDVGVAALAAAIRTVASSDASMRGKTTERRKKRRKKKKASKEPTEEGTEQEALTDTKNESTDTTEAPTERETESKPRTILKRLDLSGCGIGDVGAEALAIALTNNPLCIQHLDLSNNKITDQGAAALAQALDASRPSSGCIETLDLSHNKDLGDSGAKQLASAFQRNGISKLILQSCKIRADGAACFGAALRSIGLQAIRSSSSSPSGHRVIDLSGNPLGILSKTKKSGIKHSATALRSKATDTTKAYMNIIGKSLQKGLNSFNGVDTLESDDEEEEGMGDNEEEDESMKKCGALSLAEAFLRDGGQDETKDKTVPDSKDQDRIPVHIELGLRHCSFDTKAAEALAAVLVESKQNPNMKISMDMAMNHVLEEEILAALHDEEGYEDQLSDMAEVYLDALEVMREARERALRASRMAASRAKAQAEREAAWAAPPPSFGYDDEDYGKRRGGWSNDDDDDEDDWEDQISDDYEQNLEEEDYSDESW